jgi:NADH dehydrogenase (ubiquinone) Fe-S protein 1
LYTEESYASENGGADLRCLSLNFLRLILDFRANYLFNDKINSIEEADAILLVGTNPRHEAPVLNARIRKAFLYSEVIEIGVIGSKLDLTYDFDYLGSSASAINDLLGGNSPFAKVNFLLTMVHFCS